MICPPPPTTIAMLPNWLVLGTLAIGMGVNWLYPILEQRRWQKQRGAAARNAAARLAARAAARPRVVTGMKDLARLEAALTGPGRRVTKTGKVLVLTTPEAALIFRPGADNVIAAELARGDAEAAKALLLETQARYVAAVREDTAAQLQEKAPAAGWTVEKRETARDGSIQVTLQRPTPRKKKAVAIG